MQKIKLTEQEIRLIRQSLEDDGYFAKKGEMIMLVNRMMPEEDMKCYDKLLKKALKAERDHDAWREVNKVWNCDVLLWYYKQWLAQGNKDMIGLRKDR